MTASRVALWIAVSSTILRLLVAVVAPVSDRTENMRVGVALATERRFADPFPEPTGATAHVAPVLPLIIAGSIALAGSHEAGFKLARCVLILILGVFIARLPALARLLGINETSGVLAAIAIGIIGLPLFAWMEVTGQHEGVLTGVVMASLTASTIAFVATGAQGRGNALALGAAWGAAMHVSPTLVMPMTAIWLTLLTFRAHRAVVLTATPAAVVGFLLTVTPWVVRNAHAVGTPAFIRDNFGLELAMSHGPAATWHMATNMSDTRTMSGHPYFSREAALEMRRLGEANYYRLKQQEAVRWIRENPVEFAKLTVKRTLYFFLPVWDARGRAYFFIPVVALWLAGSLLLFRDNRSTCIALNSALVAFGLPHFLVQSSTRYSYPILWILVLLASDAVVRLWSKFSAAQGRRDRALATRASE